MASKNLTIREHNILGKAAEKHRRKAKGAKSAKQIYFAKTRQPAAEIRLNSRFVVHNDQPACFAQGISII